MGVLIAGLWRALFPSVWIWTLVGMAEVVLHGHGMRTGVSGLSLIPIANLFLAAALGTRALTIDSRSEAGTWLRALPLDRTRLVLLRLGFSFACLLASVLATGWFLFAGRSLAWLDASVEPSRQQWILAGYSLPLILLASAYFASSFERAGASRQASLPGFLSGIGLGSVMLPRPWSLAGFVAIVALGLLGICRLQARRGIDGASQTTSLLGDLRPMDRVIVLPAQLLFVIVPLVSLWSYWLSVPAPYLSLTTLQASIGFWLAVGALAAPWGWRDLGTRGLRGARRVAGLVLIGSGVGLFPWRMVRKRGASIACVSCGRRRVCSITSCPRCGGRQAKAEPSHKLTRFVPKTPVAFLFSLIALLVGCGCLFGRERFVHVYDVRVDLPGAEITLGDRVASGKPLRGCGLGPRMGGWWADRADGSVKLPRPQELPIEVQELASSLTHAESAPLDSRLPPPHKYLADLLGSRILLNVSYRGRPCVLRRGWRVSVQTHNFVVGTDVWLHVVCPELEDFVKKLLQANSENAVTEEQLSEAVRWGDTFFEYLMRQRGESPRERAQARELFDSLVAKRYDLNSSDAGPVLADFDRKVEWIHAWTTSSGSMFSAGDLPHVAAEVRALGMKGESIAGELRQRIERGDPWSVIAAGSGKVTSCWEACVWFFQAKATSYDFFHAKTSYGLDEEARCAAWAMLSIDFERGFTILKDAWSRMSGQRNYGRYQLACLLGFTGRAEAMDWLRSEVADRASTSEDREGLAIAEETLQSGFVLDDYLF